MEMKETIYGNKIRWIPKEQSETGIYIVYYGEYEDVEEFYFPSYETAITAMKNMATAPCYGDRVAGPYPLYFSTPEDFT